MMFSRGLFLLLLLLPLLELYLLIQVGSIIGAIPTIALVVFTAVLGVLLLRQQGTANVRRIQYMMQRGEAPTVAMLEGALILLSGILLLLPGLLTDVLGLLGLVPSIRQSFIRALSRRAVYPRPPPRDSSTQRGPATLEGQYTRED